MEMRFAFFQNRNLFSARTEPRLSIHKNNYIIFTNLILVSHGLAGGAL